MEHLVDMPVQDVIPADVNMFMIHRIKRQSAEHMIEYLYDHFNIAYSYNLDDLITGYSSHFSSDGNTLVEPKTQAFAQGMLLGVATAYDWLHRDELDSAYMLSGETDMAFTIAGNDSLAEDDGREEPDWAHVLLDFGTKSLDLVAGYKPLVVQYSEKLLYDDALRAHFQAGAGLMMRLMMAHRRHKRTAEITQLGKLLALTSYKSDDVSDREAAVGIEEKAA